MHILSAQYELVKESREVVFEYCEHFSKADYVKGLENFNKKSVRDLQIHVANVYLHWLEAFAMQKEIKYVPENVKRIQEVYDVYRRINASVSAFINHFQGKADIAIENKFPGKETILKTTPLELMTHVITHEFHHKGQILVMGRMMGYTPPDADIIRA